MNMMFSCLTEEEEEEMNKMEFGLPIGQVDRRVFFSLLIFFATFRLFGAFH